MNPMPIQGNWDDGYIMDMYTISSRYIGEDVFGHPLFDTVYTEIGQLIHDMKYNGHFDTSVKIAELCTPFLREWLEDKDVDIILPSPPTQNRPFQPVFMICDALSGNLSIPFSSEVLEKVTTVQSKDLPRDAKNLSGSVRKLKPAKRKCNILLIDDFYSTGSTANECVSVLKADALIDKVYYLAIVRTK